MKHINPATEKETEVEEFFLFNLDDIIDSSRKAQAKWKKKSVQERIQALSSLPEILRKQKQEIAETVAYDMGKPVKKAKKEVDQCIAEYEYYAENAPKALKDRDAAKGKIIYEPRGIVCIISPWNYPFSTAFLSALPALMAGNSIIIKPSEFSPYTALKQKEIFTEILPDSLVQIIIGGKKHGKALVENDIDMVCFTGSVEGGKSVMRTSADKLHKVLLELGGLDPAIVLDDVDVSELAEEIVCNNANNSGQVCSAIKRAYVHRDIFEDFVEKAVKVSENLAVGDPMQDVDMGPLSSKMQLEKVESMLIDSLNEGARLESGGSTMEGKGFFFPHTILTNVDHDMQIMKEEPFGPILPIFPIEDADEAIGYANDSRYGLTASVWTKDEEKGYQIARKLEAGVVSVNKHGGGPMGAPWGGMKQSGLGRSGYFEGIREFTEIKFLW